MKGKLKKYNVKLKEMKKEISMESNYYNMFDRYYYHELLFDKDDNDISNDKYYYTYTDIETPLGDTLRICVTNCPKKTRIDNINTLLKQIEKDENVSID